MIQSYFNDIADKQFIPGIRSGKYGSIVYEDSLSVTTIVITLSLYVFDKKFNRSFCYG